MFTKNRGVVLHSIKYSDTASIVHVFSREHGRLSFSLPRSSGRAARMKSALFMPLSLLEIDTDLKPGREIHSVRDVRTAIPTTGISIDPVKNAIALFVAELLGKIVRGGEENAALFDYVENSIVILDSMTQGTANFHICFLLRLGVFLGIEPDALSYRPGYWFDLNEGLFTPSPDARHRMVAPETAAVLTTIFRMRFANMHLFKFTREQRGVLLDTILDYYAIHNSTLSPLRSPDILKQLFT